MPNKTAIFVTTSGPNTGTGDSNSLNVNVTPFLGQAVAGISYMVTTGLATVLAGQHRRILIQNPYGSGVNVNIYSMTSSDNSLGFQTHTLYIDPQTPLPPLANVPTPQNLLIDPAGDTDLSKISFSWDISTSSFTGGEQNTSFLSVGGENSKFDPGILVLEQGATVALDTIYANTAMASFTMYFFEQAPAETNQPVQTGTPIGLLMAITRLGP